MAFVLKSKLPRLSREFYQGRAAILWTHTLEHRASGWLDDRFHYHFREILLHACHRFHLATPCYVLMPDHWHLVWIGLSESADQWLATAFLRKHLQSGIRAKLQDRAHDHVLRENERKRGAFQSACRYVCQNPERAGLCPDWREWPYVGTVVAGYPNVDLRDDGFWNVFWRIHAKLVDEAAFPALTRRATHDLPACSGPLREQRDKR